MTKEEIELSSKEYRNKANAFVKKGISSMRKRMMKTDVKVALLGKGGEIELSTPSPHQRKFRSPVVEKVNSDLKGLRKDLETLTLEYKEDKKKYLDPLLKYVDKVGIMKEEVDKSLEELNGMKEQFQVFKQKVNTLMIKKYKEMESAFEILK